MPPRIWVDRCVCQRVPFGALLADARAAGWTLLDVERLTGCGLQCGLCRPYLRRMLETGETAFTELLAETP